MSVKTNYIKLSTQGNSDVIDITPQVAKKLTESGLSEGTVTIFVAGSTAALTTVEYEPGLVHDIKELFEKIAPSNKEYHHNERWHDDNGHSHVRAS
ncbi:MAG: secondary thiamine-phosphate synthase enzyme, partial [Planctomycetes bacterium RBG_16_43_13]